MIELETITAWIVRFALCCLISISVGCGPSGQNPPSGSNGSSSVEEDEPDYGTIEDLLPPRTEDGGDLNAPLGPLTSSQEMVAHLYRSVLGRNPDQPAFGLFAQAIDTDEATVADIVRIFVFSEEAQQKGITSLANRDFVAKMYEVIFRRVADQSGLNLWTGALDSGSLNKNQLVDSFLGSQEFTDLLIARGLL